MTAATSRSTSRVRIDQLRGAADVAAMAGASDAAIAIDYEGDLRIVDSVAGSFAERTLQREDVEQSALPATGHQRWLSPGALRRLGEPPQARILLVPAHGPWDGALLLRFDDPPHPSRYDLAAIDAALRRVEHP